MKHEPEVWRNTFQDDGYLIVRDLLPSELLSRLCAVMDRITRDPESLPAPLKREIFLERDHVKNNPQWYPNCSPEHSGNAVRQIAKLLSFDPVFIELLCYRPLLDVLMTLFDSPEFGLHLMVGRPKAARVGNGISNGAFHRDTPQEQFTSANIITAMICMDEMTNENGATKFVRGSHNVSDEEARDSRWREIAADELNPADQVSVCCPAGAGIFFSSKIIHAAGHNRSNYSRSTVQSVWTGPDVLATSAERHPYEGLRPRSEIAAYRTQMRMTFPEFFAGREY
jgi:Phytanoyl-CoA dioxygenase (PhyH)